MLLSAGICYSPEFYLPQSICDTMQAFSCILHNIETAISYDRDSVALSMCSQTNCICRFPAENVYIYIVAMVCDMFSAQSWSASSDGLTNIAESRIASSTP